jgi:hypothetical protein
MGMGPKPKDDSVLNGIVRHVLTAVGGSFVAKGYIVQSELELAAGAIATIVGVIWSAYSKRKQSK